MPARAGYELSKLPQSRVQSAASNLLESNWSVEKAARAVRQRKGRAAPQKGTHQTFFADDGWKVIVSGARRGNYHDIEQALIVALDEVRHRINSGCKLY